MKYTSSYKKISVPENSFCLIKSLTKVTLTSLQTTAKQSVHFKKQLVTCNFYCHIMRSMFPNTISGANIIVFLRNFFLLILIYPFDR